jgi:hypothetical protein
MSYSFLKESKLFIVYGGNKYRIYTDAALDFSQTFAQDSYPVKTLHNQAKMVEGANITTANAADFSFNVPLTKEKDESPIISLIQGLSSDNQLTSFDIYVQTGSASFKVDSAHITSANFDISPNKQFTVRVQGQGTKLEKVGDESYTIPGNAPSGSNWDTVGSNQLPSSTRTPLLVYPVVTIDSLNMNNIISTNFSITNETTWTSYKTLQKSLLVTSASNIMRQSDYVVEKRNISGNVVQYQTDNNINQFDDFSTTSNITIKAVEVGKAASATPFLQIQLNPASFTARMAVSDAFTQSYDFRLIDNSTTFNNIITQYS